MIKLIVSFYAVAQRTVSLCCCDNRLSFSGCFINILYVGIYDFSLYQIVEWTKLSNEISMSNAMKGKDSALYLAKIKLLCNDSGHRDVRLDEKKQTHRRLVNILFVHI